MKNKKEFLKLMKEQGYKHIIGCFYVYNDELWTLTKYGDDWAMMGGGDYKELRQELILKELKSINKNLTKLVISK